MSDVDYLLVGPWWTLDAPSLRLPRPRGVRLDVWSAGSGPSLLLVAEGGRSAWTALLPYLARAFSVHVLERGGSATGALDAVEVAAAAEALGAEHVLASGAGADPVLAALPLTATLTSAVLLGARPRPVPDSTAAVHVLDLDGADPAAIALAVVALLSPAPLVTPG